MFKTDVVKIPKEKYVMTFTKLVETPYTFKLPDNFPIPKSNETTSEGLSRKHVFNLYQGTARLVRRIKDSEYNKIRGFLNKPNLNLTYVGSNSYIENDYLITEIDSSKLPRDVWIPNSQNIIPYEYPIDLTFEFDKNCYYSCTDSLNIARKGFSILGESFVLYPETEQTFICPVTGFITGKAPVKINGVDEIIEPIIPIKKGDTIQILSNNSCILVFSFELKIDPRDEK